MAASVAQSTTSQQTTSQTGQVVSLPGSMTSGNTAIIGLCYPNAGTLNPLATGWTRIVNANRSVGPAIAAFWREVDGTEGSTITVTLSSADVSAHAAIEISGAEDPDTSPPEVGTAAQGNSSTPNPPSVTPSGGQADYLWVPIVGVFGTGSGISAGPSGYSNLLTSGQGTTWPYTTFAMDWRGNDAASEDPGTFTADSSRDWVTNTIAVYPASAAAAQGVGANMAAARNLIDGSKQISAVA